MEIKNNVKEENNNTDNITNTIDFFNNILENPLFREYYINAAYSDDNIYTRLNILLNFVGPRNDLALFKDYINGQLKDLNCDHKTLLAFRHDLTNFLNLCEYIPEFNQAIADCIRNETYLKNK